MENILVIGGGGQLGQCLKKTVSDRAIPNVIFPAAKSETLFNNSSLSALFELHKPKFVINCAAYTAVDLAEDEVDKANQVNHQAALLLAQICNHYKATLIHISTDFVFGGNQISLLNEIDTTEPISVYGQSKLKGEQAIIASLDKHIIIRTSWLYSEYGNNFVKTMLKLGEERDQLNIIADQVGTPTYAIDLANAIFDIIELNANNYGVYHFSNEGVTSWYDFAVAIFKHSAIQVIVNPIPSSAYPTKAKRPAFSVMDKTKIKNTFGLSIAHWNASLEKCISNLKSNIS